MNLITAQSGPRYPGQLTAHFFRGIRSPHNLTDILTASGHFGRTGPETPTPCILRVLAFRWITTPPRQGF